jgi:hypothetical protein
MSAVQLLGMAASASLLAGWRLYACVAALGLAMRVGLVDLPSKAQALDVLANPWVIGAAAIGALAEFFADKVMWIDTVWDGAHTLIRPLGGALIALAIVDPSEPVWQVAAFLLGGGAALITHRQDGHPGGGEHQSGAFHQCGGEHGGGRRRPGRPVARLHQPRHGGGRRRGHRDCRGGDAVLRLAGLTDRWPVARCADRTLIFP